MTAPRWTTPRWLRVRFARTDLLIFAAATVAAWLAVGLLILINR